VSYVYIGMGQPVSYNTLGATLAVMGRANFRHKLGGIVDFKRLARRKRAEELIFH
jgi:hypothetical protein